MSVPNQIAVVHQVRNSQVWPFRSKAHLCAYTQAVIQALYAVDTRFGNLMKAEAQNHCKDSQGRRHATDVALFKTTGQIVDFISSAGYEPDLTKPEPANEVIWRVGPENEYPETSWFAPVAGAPVPPTPEPPVPPIPPIPQPPSDLEPRLAALEAAVTANKERMEAINTRFHNESQFDNVKKPLPEYIGKLFGFTVTSRPRT